MSSFHEPDTPAACSKFTMPLTQETFDALRPTGDFIAVAPSFHVLIVPAVAGAVALGPLQAVAALGWLQIMQPRWQPGPPLEWLAQPWVLGGVTLLAAVEFVWDKVPGWDKRQSQMQLRFIPWVAGALAMAAVRNQPWDVMIGGGLLAAMLAAFIHCAVVPARDSILEEGMAPFVTPIASIVQSLLCFSLLLPMSQMPILAGVLLLVVLLACGFILVLDRKPMAQRWRRMFGLRLEKE